MTAQPEAVTHLVCCRAPSWDVALCGFATAGGALNTAGDDCAMCIETALGMWASRGEEVRDEHCHLDGIPCPSDAEIFERIVRETG
jgi:hypothetical protein